MIVFGDHDRVEDAADVLARVEDICERAKGLPRHIERHGERVRAFILAAELAQGIADRDFEAGGSDADSPAQRGCGRLLMHVAGLVLGKPDQTPMPGRHELDLIAAQGMLRLRTGEGHAFYALYPESYAGPAVQSGLGPDTHVIGIRSIGTGLAAIVAAALGAGHPFSVRPVGHPFSRELRIGDGLKEKLLADPGAAFAIVDEGPGLSGSSFAAVIDWLRDNGVAPSRIRLFPSHGGEPGAKASLGVRASWSQVRKHPADQELHLGAKREFARWFADRTGPLDAIVDVSGGEWRRNLPPSAWPPSDRRFERRKFLLQAGARVFLAKFAGLDEGAVAKMTAARRLGAAGLAPMPVALRHGILLEEWHAARPVDPMTGRAAWLDTAARYIGFRARMLEPVNAGASAGRLMEMATHNAGVALGPDAAHRLRQRLEARAGAMARSRPVYSDNRMHAWEWIVTAQGQILKTDALDHACGHDLVGCQDVAWDVAGAIAEFCMDKRQANAFIDQVGREAARPVNDELVVAMIGCYLAFQLGLWTLAAQAGDQTETPRLLAQAERYESLLAGWIAGAASPGFDLNGSFTSMTTPSSSPPMITPTSAPAPRPPAATT